MPSLLIRPVTEQDCGSLYRLAMSESVRLSSVRSDPFTEDEHHDWLTQKLADRNTKMWVAIETDQLVAQVRYTKAVEGQPMWTGGPTFGPLVQKFAEVAISVAGNRRGRGLGTVMLSATEGWVRESLGVTVLSALVLPANTPSLRLFQSVGYQFCGSTERMGKDLSVYQQMIG